MSRTPRSALPDGYFHVFARGVPAPDRLFGDDDDRATFVDLVWRVAASSRWTCHAICVMATHYHLVLETTRANLSAGLHRLNWRYARYANAKRDRFGDVFAERFGARSIEGEEYLFEACAYVVLNPVRAGLCDLAEEWQWSYSAYGLSAS